MKILFFAIAILFSFSALHAQQEDTIKSSPLQEVIVKAFENNRRLKDVPSAINYINREAIERFSSASMLQAINTTPGVRMEERSPGSYRINIRGSSLRSPFGVRNLKVYYNDIPITDPGGVTYLNQLGVYNFNSLEIIKGPGSSLYGAGTGGVMLIESSNKNKPHGAGVEYTNGSFGLKNFYANITFGDTSGNHPSVNSASFQHQESSGYREHSAMKRDVHSWSGIYHFGAQRELKTTFLYGKLFYETPGALVKAEYDSSPKLSRPGSAVFPSAIKANASITQSQFIAGISVKQPIFSWLQNTSVLYGMFTELRNPAIQNYGRNSEPHVGGRTVFTFNTKIKQASLKVDAGAEWQTGFASLFVYKNVGGNADSLRSTDDISTRQSLIFAQTILDYKQWTFTAGASLNFFRIRFERFAPASLGKLSRMFSNQLEPRFAALRKFGNINIYSSISKGFSPPTPAELVPTGGNINLALNPEQGINYDAGIKGTLLKDLYFDVNAFNFSLSNTIVLRRNAGGGDAYVNAGKTRQHGIETFLSYSLLHSSQSIAHSSVWLSHTWHSFHYKDFKQLTNDYSGNKLPGVSPQVVSAGWDVTTTKGFEGAVSYYFSDKIPLNDANGEYAKAYHLVSLKGGYEMILKQNFNIKITAGVDNLLNQKYSLGSDINAFWRTLL